jgi:SAM-dependent methyltransferase
VGADSLRKIYSRDYVRPRTRDRVLDLGCGPGDILDYLPDVDYVGIDLSSEYIEAAQNRFGSRGRFISKPVEEFVVEEPSSFDIVMANGVVHHLDDSFALSVYGLARTALKPGGRFVSIDPALVRGQSLVARILVNSDRGRYVRSPEGYTALASQVFRGTKVSVRHDLLRIPFTHTLLECSDGDV